MGSLTRLGLAFVVVMVSIAMTRSDLNSPLCLVALLGMLELPTMMENFRLIGMYGTADRQLRERDIILGNIPYYGGVIPTLAVTYSHSWDLSSIGVVEANPAVAIVVGLAVAPLYWVGTQKLYVWLARTRSTNHDDLMRSTNRDERPRLVFALVHTGILSPIVQEVVHRGVFVVVLGNNSSWWLSVPFGLLVFCMLHLHFGGKGLLVLLAFYALTVVLLLVPGVGLIGAIVFHITCNTIIVIASRVRRGRSHSPRT